MLIKPANYWMQNCIVLSIIFSFNNTDWCVLYHWKSLISQLNKEHSNTAKCMGSAPKNMPQFSVIFSCWYTVLF